MINKHSLISLEPRKYFFNNLRQIKFKNNQNKVLTMQIEQKNKRMLKQKY